MSVVLNSRNIVVGIRAANCRSASIIENDSRIAEVIVGCGGGKCKRSSKICQAQGAYLQYVRDIQDQSGNPLDISSSLVTFTVFTSVKGSVLLTRTTADSSIIRVSNTRVQWEIDGTDSLALAAKSHYYELWVTSVSGDPYLAEYGTFVIQDTRKYDA